jgi:hypothetical protein
MNKKPARIAVRQKFVLISGHAFFCRKPTFPDYGIDEKERYE